MVREKFVPLCYTLGGFMKINLTTDIVYQADSIVSKTIMKNDGGNITLFAFDTRQGLSEHTAPFDATFYCVDGKFKVTVGTEEHEIAKEDLLILPANIPHSVTALTPAKCLLVMIKVRKE